MTTDKGEGKKSAGKGFAGLSEMLSKVEQDDSADESPARQDKQSEPTRRAFENDKTSTAQSTSAIPTSEGTPVRWLIAIGLLVGIAWIVSALSGQSSSKTPSQGSESVTQAWQSAPAEPPVVNEGLATEKPPIGQDHVLWGPQIRYCLAEEIRLAAAESLVNSDSQYDVDRFNGMVDDYNSRCGSFRYRTGVLESARREVEAYRRQLEAEGRSRFAVAPVGLLDNAPDRDGLAEHESPQEPSLDARVDLTAEAAANSQVLSSDESESLEAACSQQKFLEGPAAYERCKQSQLSELSEQGPGPDLSGLSDEERGSIEAACSVEKYLNGPAAYNKCRSNQAARLAAQVERPKLSGLTPAELESIEAACAPEKYLDGPSDYNRCLSNQLAQLSQASTSPDLSRLSPDQRDSIEAACSTQKYLEGPASYRKCVANQVAQLVP